MNCGNWQLHDLAMAKFEAREFLSKEWSFEYPTAKRAKAGKRTVFDA